jgi:glutamate-1-semialdehyde 2,1-aminomutase
LPNKVLAKIGPWTALELMLKRLERATSLDKIVILTPDNPENDRLAEYVKGDLQYPVVRGDEHDVLARYAKAAAAYPSDYYVRLTADCPLICPEIVDQVVNRTIDTGAAYGSNINPPTFPDGFDVECMSADALNWLSKNAYTASSREHVTSALRQNSGSKPNFKIFNLIKLGNSAANIRLTLDHPEDHRVFEFLFSIFGAALETISADRLIEQYRANCLERMNGQFI